jgi:hypothetical protein
MDGPQTPGTCTGHGPHHSSICHAVMNSNDNNASGRFDGHRLALVATMMDNFVRGENDGLQRENDALLQIIQTRNMYIAEIQDDFNRVIRWSDVQRAALAEFAAAVEILQERLNHYEPDAPFQYLVATDANHIFHAIRVESEQLRNPHGTQETEVIDLTTDTELDTDTD